MSREERFICGPCGAYYEKIGDKFICPKCKAERVKCADCARAHSLHPKGGAVIISGGHVINLLEPFVYCQAIRYYKLYPATKDCKDFLTQYWNTTNMEVD